MLDKLTFSFKDGIGCQSGDLQKMQPATLMVLAQFVAFCTEQKLPCQITNVVQKFGVSKSTTHPEGRAFDASVKGWDASQIEKCEEHMEANVGHLGAWPYGGSERKVVVYHDAGLGKHFHFQVSRGLYGFSY